MLSRSLPNSPSILREIEAASPGSRTGGAWLSSEEIPSLERALLCVIHVLTPPKLSSAGLGLIPCRQESSERALFGKGPLLSVNPVRAEFCPAGFALLQLHWLPLFVQGNLMAGSSPLMDVAQIPIW